MSSPTELKENPAATDVFGQGSLNLPNIITFSRLILTLILLVMIDIGGMWIVCTVIFVVAVATDVLDGYFARLWNQVTVLGRIMDPFVDKMIIGGTLIFLTNLEGSGVCSWITFIVIGREMFITGLRSVLEGHGVDFSAKWSGKIKMVIQSVTIPFCLISLSPEFVEQLGEWHATFLLIRKGLLIATVAITVYSGVEYTWRGFQLLSKKAKEVKQAAAESDSE